MSPLWTIPATLGMGAVVLGAPFFVGGGYGTDLFLLVALAPLGFLLGFLPGELESLGLLAGLVAWLVVCGLVATSSDRPTRRLAMAALAIHEASALLQMIVGLAAHDSRAIHVLESCAPLVLAWLAAYGACQGLLWLVLLRGRWGLR